MATTTTNLSLKKPALDDDALIADINNNMDTLDSTIGAPSSASAVDGANAFAKINSLNSNIANGHLVAKYLNDTSKTAIQLLTADFSNVNLGDIQFYRIRPSDDNLYGFIVKHSATYAYGLFAGMNTGDSYNIVNSNGTWTKEKLALDSKIENNSTTELSNSGLGCTYIKRGGYCYARISGTPTTTSNITFTVPKALVGAYITCGQWAQTSTIMQAYIDANSTTLTVRNHALVGVNVTIMYPYA